MTREQRRELFEAVGFVAIMASFIFLALEIRQNTSQMRAEADFSINELRQALNESQYGDATLVDLLIRGAQDINSLNPVERQRFARYQFSRLNLAEYILYLHDEGLSDLHSKYIDYIVGDFNSNPGLAEWIAQYDGAYAGTDELYSRLTGSEE